MRSGPRVVTNDSLDQGRQVPAALNLPFGKLFFGYPVVPFKAPETESSGGPATSSASSQVGPNFSRLKTGRRSGTSV